MIDVWKQITHELSELLKPYGFRKSGLSFVDIQNKEVIRQIKMEKFRWNTAEFQRFQLLVSLYLATNDFGEFTFKGQNTHYSLVFQKNAGYFWGEEGFLYLIPKKLPDQGFFTELNLHITHYIMPFLDRCKSIDAVICLLEQENLKLGQNFFSATLAVALARLGRTEESRTHFQQCIGDRDSIRQLAQQYGIRLE